MTEPALLIRVAALYAPMIMAFAGFAAWRPPNRRLLGAVLAVAWNFSALLVVNAVAISFGWWSFAAAPSLHGVPIDLLIGWAVLWGAVPALIAPNASIVSTVFVLLALDALLMPLAAPVVVLMRGWWAGEAVALCTALIPGLLLVRWTEHNRHVRARAALQAIMFTMLLFWVVPSAIHTETGNGGWHYLLSTWQRFGGLALQLALLPAILGLSAVQEFAARGQGTPLPFDPPRTLVTSGPYAYVANPMQLSIAILLPAWALITMTPWLLAAAPVAFVYSYGFADADERADLRKRFGEPWFDYRRLVRDWLPRWRPYHASLHDRTRKPARLYVAQTCGPCSEVAAWFAARQPTALEIVPAERHPTRDLNRITYDSGDGEEQEGVAAIARALEHIHLGWALAGWLMRLPGLRAALQLIVDATGGAPRRVPRQTPECTI